MRVMEIEVMRKGKALDIIKKLSKMPQNRFECSVLMPSRAGRP